MNQALEPLRKSAKGSDDAEVRRRAKELVNTLETRLRGELRCFEGHNGVVESVAFSPDGKRALSGSDDGTMRLWNVETGEELRCFKGHTSWVRSVVFSPDGKRALSGSLDWTVRLWDVDTGKELHCFKGQTNGV